MLLPAFYLSLLTNPQNRALFRSYERTRENLHWLWGANLVYSDSHGWVAWRPGSGAARCQPPRPTRRQPRRRRRQFLQAGGGRKAAQPAARSRETAARALEDFHGAACGVAGSACFRRHLVGGPGGAA